MARSQNDQQMRERITRTLKALAMLGIIIMLGWALLFIFRRVWFALLAANSQLAVSLVTAGTAMLVAKTTVMLGRYYERKRDIDAQFRSEKIKIYDQFLSELFKLFHSESEAPSEGCGFSPSVPPLLLFSDSSQGATSPARSAIGRA